MEWEAETGMHQWSTSTFGNSCGCTHRPGHAGLKGNDRTGSPAGKVTLTSGLLLGKSSVEELETLPVGTKPSTAHHRSPGGERGVERGSARRSSLKGRERAIVSQGERWNRFKGNVGETSERRGGAHTFMGFSERIDTIMNRNERKIKRPGAGTEKQALLDIL